MSQIHSLLWSRPPDLKPYDTGMNNQPSEEALNLLTTLTANNSSAMQDTTHITNSYDEYLIIYRNLIPIVNNDGFLLQVQDGGSFKATNYIGLMEGIFAGASSTPTFASINATTGIAIADNNTHFFGVAGSTSTIGGGLSGFVFLHAPNSTSALKNFTGRSNWAGNSAGNVTSNSGSIGGFYTGDTGAITGFQVIATSGSNINSGTVKLYGINT